MLVRTGVSALVRARERYSCRSLGTRASHNIELRALHVELSSGVGIRRVESNDLVSGKSDRYEVKGFESINYRMMYCPALSVLGIVKVYMLFVAVNP